jgi:hypothetical protein
MLKKAARRALRLARNWLAEEEVVEDINYGAPPFCYRELNCLLRRTALEKGGLERPDYAWAGLQGLNLAKVLGLPRVSFIEFGVAGGNGLVALENIARHLQTIFGIEIDVYGFDAVGGLPKSRDHRDLPNLWREGSYSMDPEKLERRLKKAKLILGLVEETMPKFLEAKFSPVAFIAFDLCFYSSTMKAFQIFEADHSVLLPRVHCFFRNILGRTFGDHNGERLAISDFNASHVMQKISKIHGLQYYLGSDIGQQRWVDQVYMAHIFDHESYGIFDGLIDEQARDLQDESV